MKESKKKEKERKGLNEGRQAKGNCWMERKNRQRKGSVEIRGRERNPWKETKRKQKERKFQPMVSLKTSLSSRGNGATGRRHQEKENN